ncbi:MAG: 16S rRNA (cytosine(1402)-N(4))-methyltransferase RsmH [Candidatus Neomarinimicrobiota bacterium]
MKKIWQKGTRSHVPVMPQEVLSHLNIIKDGLYIDGTIGLGGHSSLMLNQLSKKGHLIGIDRDVEAIKICKKSLTSHNSSLSLFNDSYNNIGSILDQLKINKVNGILLDLGLSSMQLEKSNRGFSHKINSDLDMRFDISQKIKASDIINQVSEHNLADIIYYNGEERRARSIARNIAKMRPIYTVNELIESIRRSTPPLKRNKTISRVFQAIRIAVNDELEKLDEFLSFFYKKLCVGGRIVIISFHSLEDRRVKHCFKALQKEKKIEILTKKPITPGEKEIFENRKSRSAKLRSAQRID